MKKKEYSCKNKKIKPPLGFPRYEERKGKTALGGKFSESGIETGRVGDQAHQPPNIIE